MDKRWSICLKCKSNIMVIFSKQRDGMSFFEDLASMNQYSEPLAVMHGDHRFSLHVLGGAYSWGHLIQAWHGWFKDGKKGLEGWSITVELPAEHKLFVMPADGRHSKLFAPEDAGEWWFDPKKGWSRG